MPVSAAEEAAGRQWYGKHVGMVAVVLVVFVFIIIFVIWATVRTCGKRKGNCGGNTCDESAWCTKFLTSDQKALAPALDLNMVNPWGIAATTDPDSDCCDDSDTKTNYWIAENGAGLVELVTSAGGYGGSAFTVPIPVGSSALTSAPSGVVVNHSSSTSSFLITSGSTTLPATVIVVTEDGSIAGYNPLVSASAAITVVDNASTGAIYKGCALLTNPTTKVQYLFVTNFFSGGIEVYSGTWALVTTFTDPALTVSSGPAGFAPFGIKAHRGSLYVTFALQDTGKSDAIAGAGLGFIDRFDVAGTYQSRLATGGALDAPWGLAFCNDRMYVGNFGDGTISVFGVTESERDECDCGCSPCKSSCSSVCCVTKCTCRYVGRARSGCDSELRIDGLWGLQFVGSCCDKMLFTAGVNAELDGVFGSLTSSSC